MLVIFAGDVLFDGSRQRLAIGLAEGQEEDIAGTDQQNSMNKSRDPIYLAIAANIWAFPFDAPVLWLCTRFTQNSG